MTDIGASMTNVAEEVIDIGANMTDIVADVTNIGDDMTDIGTNITDIVDDMSDIGANMTDIRACLVANMTVPGTYMTDTDILGRTIGTEYVIMIQYLPAFI